MQTANWTDVWKLGLSVFTHEPIALQIFIGLVAALAALMMIEGLRASFFPQRRAEAIKPANMLQPVTIEPVKIEPAKIEPAEPEVLQIPQAMAAANPPPRSFAATRPQRSARKRRAMRVSRQKAPRPTIKRMANAPSSEIAAE